MIRASVVGPIWATKRLDDLPPGALLEVVEVGTGQRVVALDQLGAGPGDAVLVALGAAVAHHLPGTSPTDALIVGIVDERTERAPAPADAAPRKGSPRK